MQLSFKNCRRLHASLFSCVVLLKFRTAGGMRDGVRVFGLANVPRRNTLSSVLFFVLRDATLFTTNLAQLYAVPLTRARTFRVVFELEFASSIAGKPAPGRPRVHESARAHLASQRFLGVCVVAIELLEMPQPQIASRL